MPQLYIIADCNGAGKTTDITSGEITLLFFWLLSSEEAIMRVAERVRMGGHHIPEDVLSGDIKGE